MRRNSPVIVSASGALLMGAWTVLDWVARLDFARQLLTADSDVRRFIGPFLSGVIEPLLGVHWAVPLTLTAVMLVATGVAFWWPDNRRNKAQNDTQGYPDLSVAQAVRHINLWYKRRGSRRPTTDQTALDELRGAVVRGDLAAFGERDHAYHQEIPASFFAGEEGGAFHLARTPKRRDHFDDGHAYRDRDEVLYGGVRFRRADIERLWPI